MLEWALLRKLFFWEPLLWFYLGSPHKFGCEGLDHWHKCDFKKRSVVLAGKRGVGVFVLWWCTPTMLWGFFWEKIRSSRLHDVSDSQCSHSKLSSFCTGPERDSLWLCAAVLSRGQNATSGHSQALEPIQNKSKMLNPPAQINPGGLSKVSPVNEGTVFAMCFSLKAVFSLFSRPEIIATLLLSAAKHPRKNEVTNPHIWQNPSSLLTSVHKAFLLYLTFPVCVALQPGHRAELSGSCSTWLYQQESRDGDLKKQKHKQLQAARTCAALLTCKEFAPIHPPLLQIVTQHIYRRDLYQLALARGFLMGLNSKLISFPSITSSAIHCQSWTETKSAVWRWQRAAPAQRPTSTACSFTPQARAMPEKSSPCN